jgi:hypothetical protein
MTVSAHEIDFVTSVGAVKQADLRAYQIGPKGHETIQAKFVKRSDGAVGVELGKYDSTRKVVIDPLVYGSYYGGESGWDDVRSIVADVDGGVYMVGYTQSEKFPALDGPYFFNLLGYQNGFVAKLAGDAYTNVYAAYVGGSHSDSCNFAALDTSNNLWVAGYTTSTDFPGNTRNDVEFLQLSENGVGDQAPIVTPNDLGGFGPPTTTPQFEISYAGLRSVPLPWNATSAQIAAAINNSSTLAANLAANGIHYNFISIGPGQLPNSIIKVVLDPQTNQGLHIVEKYIAPGNPQQDPALPVESQGLMPRYQVWDDTGFPGGVDVILRSGMYPTGGTFRITCAGVQTTPIPYTATAATVVAAHNA